LLSVEQQHCPGESSHGCSARRQRLEWRPAVPNRDRPETRIARIALAVRVWETGSLNPFREPTAGLGTAQESLSKKARTRLAGASLSFCAQDNEPTRFIVNYTTNGLQPVHAFSTIRE